MYKLNLFSLSVLVCLLSVSNIHAEEKPLELGALTEWDPLKEVIVGGWETQWPVLTPVELSVMEASLSKESLAAFKEMQGTNMQKSQPELYERVKKEVMDLRAVFEKLGVKVYLPRAATKDDIDLYNNETGLLPWFPRDMFISHKNKIIFGSIGMPMQQKSQQLYYEIMNEKVNSATTTEMIAVPIPNFAVKDGTKQMNNVPLVDGGDVMFFGDHVFIGVSEQINMGSNLRGAQWLQKVLGDDYKVIPVRLKEEYFHLDLVMSAPREGLIMYAPEAFIDGLPDFFHDWDKIEVTGKQAMNGSLNGLPVNPKNYIIGINARDDNKWLISQMEERGIKVHPVWFDEHNLRDGSIRCATQQLLRVPE
jgi:N-dimethylarginine dimethylaminohydrolase